MVAFNYPLPQYLQESHLGTHQHDYYFQFASWLQVALTTIVIKIVIAEVE